METHIFGKYRDYKMDADREAGRELAHYVYHQLSQWLEQGRPEPEFLAAFDSFFNNLQEHQFSSHDLIDLGLIHTAEAISSYHAEEESDQVTRFYLSEARLPFFATIDENAYRMLKNFDFSEIDFQIFEVIGDGVESDFPHDAAQNFLMDNEWVDIWVVLRYLDSLPDADPDLELIERMMTSRETLHEKLILLAYLCMIDPRLISESIEEPGGRVRFNFPPDLGVGLRTTIFAMIRDCIKDGELDTAWEARLDIGSGAPFRNETIFSLLVFFETIHASLLPGWIRLLEVGVSETWTTRSLEDDQEIVYQPITEFTASILGLLSDDDLRFLMETSLLLPEFFRRLADYNPEAFQSLLMALTREDEIFLHELELALPGLYPHPQAHEFTDDEFASIENLESLENPEGFENIENLNPKGEDHKDPAPKNPESPEISDGSKTPTGPSGPSTVDAVSEPTAPLPPRSDQSGKSKQPAGRSERSYTPGELRAARLRTCAEILGYEIDLSGAAGPRLVKIDEGFGRGAGQDGDA
ncbi:MAG: hypothetical protein NXI24_24355 [bacterium]|nr:hypothetical protein [bacterium]